MSLWRQLTGFDTLSEEHGLWTLKAFVLMSPACRVWFAVIRTRPFSIECSFFNRTRACTCFLKWWVVFDAGLLTVLFFFLLECINDGYRLDCCLSQSSVSNSAKAVGWFDVRRFESYSLNGHLFSPWVAIWLYFVISFQRTVATSHLQRGGGKADEANFHNAVLVFSLFALRELRRLSEWGDWERFIELNRLGGRINNGAGGWTVRTVGL